MISLANLRRELAGDREQVLLSIDGAAADIPFGLLELDETGTVIRYSPAAERLNCPAVCAILGRNFFSEIAPVAEVNQFRARFQLFMAAGQTIDRFTTKYTTGQQDVRVQILLAHITEKSAAGRRQLALVRITSE
jgi:photoactive yellow protein